MKKLRCILLVCVLIFSMVIPSFAGAESAYVMLGNQPITTGTPAQGISLNGTTLTINNCNFSGEGYQFSASPSDVSVGLYAVGITEIVLEGTSTITVINNATETDMICGLYVYPSAGTLTISGTGSVHFQTQTENRQYADGVIVLGNMTMESGTLICEASAATNESIGLNAWGRVSVASGSSLKGYGKAASSSSMGVAVASGSNITLQDGCYLLAKSVSGAALDAQIAPGGASLIASVNQDGSNKVQFVKENYTQYRYVETGVLQDNNNNQNNTNEQKNNEEKQNGVSEGYTPTVGPIITSAKTADIGTMVYFFGACGAISAMGILKKKMRRMA